MQQLGNPDDKRIADAKVDEDAWLYGYWTDGEMKIEFCRDSKGVLNCYIRQPDENARTNLKISSGTVWLRDCRADTGELPVDYNGAVVGLHMYDNQWKSSDTAAILFKDNTLIVRSLPNSFVRSPENKEPLPDGNVLIPAGW